MIRLLLMLSPYAAAFLSALFLTLFLTPVVREVNRRLGMVDKPDPRRINKVPIPRGGGLAIVIGVNVSYVLFNLIFGRDAIAGVAPGVWLKMAILSVSIALLGLADDRWSLRPLVKLCGQVVVAFFVWWWVGFGFADIFPSLPPCLDCLLTVFWIVGAVNAFNLIDGLDGLATGLALIAILGMTGSLFFMHKFHGTFFCFSIMGGLIAFLRFNSNPASVFLGDCGSMYIGFLVATIPLASHVHDSLLVSVGVPLLAMGVPIFDTSLAILRRTLRHFLNLRTDGCEAGNGKVMTADTDHLHHRILRAMGMSQRRAAWTLYALAVGAVLVGLTGICMKSRAAGVWLLALAAASVIVFRDMASIELFDAGRLLNAVARSKENNSRRRLARLTLPFFMFADLTALVASYVLTARLLRANPYASGLRVDMILRIVPVFVLLIFFRAYTTAWSRAVCSNYCRLFLATFFGSLVGAAAVYYAPPVHVFRLFAFSLIYAVLSFTAIMTIRLARSIIRDLFYAIDCSRLKGRKDVSRILVYGAGLRYRAFRRELVRTASANHRIIVGIIDDDRTLHGKYVGGMRIMGSIEQAAEIVNETNADAVVIACDISDEWLSVVKDVLVPTGVKVTLFGFNERSV